MSLIAIARESPLSGVPLYGQLQSVKDDITL